MSEEGTGCFAQRTRAGREASQQRAREMENKMKEKSIDELRCFFRCLKSKCNGNVKALNREQISVEVDMYGFRNTDAAFIDRIITAIRYYL